MLFFWISFFLFLCGVFIALQRFLSAHLPQHVFHWCSLHMLQHSLLTKTSATHWGRANSSHRWASWKGVLLCESSSWWAYESWDWNLLWDWNKGQEIMCKHFRQIHTFKWIYDQALFDEVFRVWACLNVIRELESTSLDLLVGLLHLLRLERWATMQHGIENDTDRPEVNFIAVSIGSVEHFWCKIIWSSANCSFTLTLVENLRSKSKISNLESHSLCEEQVSQLQVSMNYLVLMNVLHRLHQLVNVKSSFNLVKPLSTLN